MRVMPGSKGDAGRMSTLPTLGVAYLVTIIAVMGYWLVKDRRQRREIEKLRYLLGKANFEHRHGNDIQAAILLQQFDKRRRECLRR